MSPPLAGGAPRRDHGGVRLPLVVAAILLAVVASGDLLRELRVASADAALDDLSRDAEQGARPLAPAPRPGGLFDSPRAQVDRALLLGRSSAMAPAPHDALASRARALVDRALTARPDWGEALVVSAYLASLDHGGTRRALADLANSYTGAPYLREAGLWRIGFALRHWDAVGPTTRLHVLDEAIWLTGVEPERYEMIFDRFRQSPAYVPLMLRWAAMREGRAEP